MLEAPEEQIKRLYPRWDGRHPRFEPPEQTEALPEDLQPATIQK
jgi:hypothetical protein